MRSLFLLLTLLLPPSQTIPPAAPPPAEAATVLYVPMVLTPPPALLLELGIVYHPNQQRATLTHDARLAAGAQAKAEAIAASGLCAHEVDGLLPPNDAARTVGFPLAEEYEEGAANQVESLACWYGSPGDALAGLVGSAPHRAHVLGEGWFGGQDRVGVGYAKSAERAGVWVVWIAEGR